MLTPYGRSTMSWSFTILAAIVVLVFVFDMNDWIRYTVLAVVAIFTLLVLNFFRDPERTVPAGEQLVIAPADGKIISIGRVIEPEFIRGEALQVCIFMSPLDVHVNRYPVSGRVGFFKHISGRFIPAFKDKASDENERTLIGIERGDLKILFKQIAGSLARRIVADISVGTPAVAGERFGMIRFGSRVDVLMPVTAAVNVNVNDRAVAGETILATLPGTA